MIFGSHSCPAWACGWMACRLSFAIFFLCSSLFDVCCNPSQPLQFCRSDCPKRQDPWGPALLPIRPAELHPCCRERTGCPNNTTSWQCVSTTAGRRP
ncbi:uncharacterized protein IWZ02DRAFT_165264 [Phyllosticta citriasiana]|uniref:uncharacterized protein n=1 Tax=Phyllosticta citriasiana TaxID=595635 RepID=UPI0030FD4534